MTLDATTTVQTLALALRQKAEEARIAKIRAAKTNMDLLMAQGVIVTCDDAMDNAFRYEMLSERARVNGTTLQMEEARFEDEKWLRTAKGILQAAVALNETLDERNARVWAAQDAAEGIKENGRKCSHRATKKERGWLFLGQNTWICCRCGVKVTVPELTEPTEQAKLAASILAA